MSALCNVLYTEHWKLIYYFSDGDDFMDEDDVGDEDDKSVTSTATTISTGSVSTPCIKGEVRRFFFICSKFLLAKN